MGGGGLGPEKKVVFGSHRSICFWHHTKHGEKARGKHHNHCCGGFDNQLKGKQNWRVKSQGGLQSSGWE